MKGFKALKIEFAFPRYADSLDTRYKEQLWDYCKKYSGAAIQTYIYHHDDYIEIALTFYRLEDYNTFLEAQKHFLVQNIT